MSDPIKNEIVAYLQALSHPTRIEILELLRDGYPMCVCEIVEKLEKEQSNISRHLTILKNQGILDLKSEGVRSFYQIKNKAVYKIVELVKSILKERIREDQAIFEAFLETQ